MYSDLLRKQLDNAELAIKSPRPDTGARLAAVLILLIPGSDGPELILTRRSEGLSSHAGQISFPGGTVETEDPDPIYTALRESSEEIGLKHDNVDILGILHWHSIPSGFLVLPVVAELKEFQEFTAAPAEVAEVFSIPLKTLLDIELYQRDTLLRNGIKREFYFLEFKEYYIWGATAKMLRSLALKLSEDKLI